MPIIAVILLFNFAFATPQIQRQKVLGFEVIYVKASLSEYQLDVGLAGRMVDVANLDKIAKKSNAVCAINGTFLAPYKGQSGEAWGTIVKNGKALHLGSVGTRMDISGEGIRFERDGLGVQGSINGSTQSPNNWYAYNLNQTPTSSTYAYIFTPERGARLGFVAELVVIAPGGVVAEIRSNMDAPIPADGFVIAIGGREVGAVGRRFEIGQRLGYWLVRKGTTERVNLQTSLGVGPRLLQNGKIAVDSVDEGFVQLVQGKAQRSAVGITAKGEVIFAVMRSASLVEEAKIMQALGAREAMNLDGGDSSGLWCKGNYAIPPGRKIPNALLLYSR